MNGLNYLLQSNLYLVIFYGFYWTLLHKETFNNYNRAYLVLSGLVSFAIPLWNLDLVQSWFITKHAADALDQMNIPNYVFSNIKTENKFDVTNYLSIIYGIGCFILAAKLFINIFNLYRFLYGIIPINKAFSFFNNIFIAEGLDPDDVIYDHERVHARQYHSFDVLLFEIIGIFCWFNPVIYLYKIAIKNIHEFIADEIASLKLPSKFDYAMLLFSEQFQTHPSVLVSNFFSKTSLKVRIEMLNKKRSNKVAVMKYGLIFPMFLGMMVFASVAIANGEKISELLAFNKNIEGTVLNYDFKPISGATVLKANSNIGAVTDKNGRFKIKTNSVKTELIFSHVSYKTKLLSVINTEPIKVTLRRYSNELQGTFVLENQNEFLDLTKNPIKVKPQNAVEGKSENVEVEKAAEYIGGNIELYEYLKSNLRYPKEAKDNKKQGIVYTQFMVNEKGEISDVRIANPLGYMSFLGHGLEAEAKRVVTNMPNWLPARQNGEAVSSDFMLPIQFLLDSQEPEPSYILDGKKITKAEAESPDLIDKIEKIESIRGPYAIAKYGDDGKNGVVVMTSKTGVNKLSRSD